MNSITSRQMGPEWICIYIDVFVLVVCLIIEDSLTDEFMLFILIISLKFSFMFYDIDSTEL